MNAKAKSPFSINLIRARNRMCWSQEQAAGIIGIKRATLASYEEDRAKPSHDILIGICNAYKITDLYGFIKDPDFLTGRTGNNKAEATELERRYLQLSSTAKRVVDLLMGLES